MKKAIFILFLSISAFIYGQDTTFQKVKNGIWFHPNNVSKINGLAIGPFNSQKWSQFDSLLINGVNTELIGNGLWVYLIPWPSYPERKYIKVNGLSLSPTFWGGTNNGVTISAISAMSKMKGCSFGIISGINENSTGFNFGFMMSESNTMKGLQIGCFNEVKNGEGVLIGGIDCIADTFQVVSISAVNYTKSIHKGLQIGLFNYTKDLNGVQIGLINYAKNSRIPFSILFNLARK
jgi:hypothetical protein